ncbi:MAG: sigma-70 family RNA polymerase sigma factor, partial [Adlercreutzia sp.]|nr:sigma-70 family RNA polymerase sigma factor [Adlercreutzia sp.]
EKRGQLRRDEAFKSWLFQIAANTCRRKLKRDGCMVPAESEAMEPPDGPQLDQADAAAVRQAFALLGEEDRLIVGLSVFGGYRSHEIGSLLQMNPSTVRSRRKRALDQMGRRLEGGAQ